MVTEWVEPGVMTATGKYTDLVAGLPGDAAGINPTTTRLNNASHPILAELAPGVRVEVPGGIPQSAPAANGGGGGGGRSSGGGGRNRARSGNASGNRSRSGGQPKSGGGKSAKTGAPANRGESRRTPSGGGGSHSAASFSSGRRG